MATCAYIRVCARVEADISSRGRKIGRVQLKRVPKRDCSLNSVSLGLRYFEWYYGIIIVGSIVYFPHKYLLENFSIDETCCLVSKRFEFLGGW